MLIGAGFVVFCILFVFWFSFWIEWGTAPFKSWYRLPVSVAMGTFPIVILFAVGTFYFTK